jgi:hypothetical protein
MSEAYALNLPRIKNARMAMAAEEYGFSFPEDRNELSKYRRPGDLNKKRLNHVLKLRECWLRVSGQEAVPSTWTVKLTPVWLNAGEFEQEPSRSSSRDQLRHGAPTAEQLMTRALSMPKDVVELAKQAAERQRRKDRATISTWIERIVEDVKDAND